MRRELVGAVILLAAQHANAGVPIEICPASLTSRQEIDVPENWRIFKGGKKNWLAEVSFFDSAPPEQTGGLIPDGEHPVKDGSRFTWNLAGQTDIWIVCRYWGVLDGITRKLEPVSECSVTRLRGGAGPVTVSCR